MSKNSILERVVFHAGKTIIFQGDIRTDAYIIQDGEILSYINDQNQRIEIDRHKAGQIIAEANLLFDDNPP